MKKRISPALGLQLKGVKTQFALMPVVTLLLLVTGFIFVPYAEVHLRAAAADSSQAEVAIGIEEAWATLTTTGDVSMEAEDNSSITVAKATATVKTNSPTGYKLYLSGNNAESNNTSSLVSDSSSAKITALNTGTTATSFTTASINTWGYGLSGADVVSDFSGMSYSEGNFSVASFSGKGFKGVRSDSVGATSLIAERNRSIVSGSDTDVYYGIHTDVSTPAGTYSANVTYTLVAEFTSNVDPNPGTPGGSGGSGGAGGYALPRPTGSDDTEGDGEPITALGVNKTDNTIASITNISDGSITWAAIAIVAGASATFLAIALLRDRDEEDEEE